MRHRIKKVFLLISLLLFGSMSLQALQPSTAWAQRGDQPIFLPVINKNYQTGYGAITGQVVDSSNGAAMPDVNVCYASLSGKGCTTTDSQGRYRFEDLRDGWTRITASKDGYNPVTENVAVLTNQTVTKNIALTMDLNLSDLDGVRQIVVTWDPTDYWPQGTENDLDAHLWVIGKLQGHISYEGGQDARNCSLLFPSACLLVDRRTGSGPETIFITKWEESADYYFGVLNYNQGRSDVPPITKTGAKVRMYGNQGLVEEIEVPAQGDGDFWYVFSIDGETQKTTIHNCITYITYYEDFNGAGDPPSCPDGE
jgi:hypothetical protein